MQFSGILAKGVDVTGAQKTVESIPGVTKFVQVFPDRDDEARLERMIVVYADDDVLQELYKTALFESIETVKPRFTCR